MEEVFTKKAEERVSFFPLALSHTLFHALADKVVN